MGLADWIAHHARWGGERIALRYEDTAITYRELDDRVRRLAAVLRHDLGLAPGDRVAHLGLNSPELVVLLFACARAGAILVPLNWRLAAPEHVFILQDCGPRVLFLDRAYVEHAAGLPGARRVVLDELAASLAADADRPLPAVPAEAPVQIVYTSGTTGRPKGAVLTQAGITWNAVMSTAAHEITSADHALTFLPMFHVGGMHIHTTPVLHAGGTVTIQRRFDPADVLRTIAQARPTLLLAVPATSQALTQHPDFAATDLASLRLVCTGSSTVPAAVIRPWLARGLPVTQVYGMTESGPVSICLPIPDAVAKVGSCGKPAIHAQARVVDDAGQDVAPGAPGEIWLRAPNLFTGYWNNPEATAEAFTDGWFRTGDIAHQDTDDFFYIDDRKKDVVISGGENIYPAELEDVLADCPAIAEAAVVGRPDARWGEVAVALVVRQPDAEIDAAAVLALFDGRLARYKHPRAVLFVDSLPRNVMGKVLKYELRDRLRSGVS